jgi:hypothetical protein
MIYRGNCHCGAVAYEVEAPEEVVCHDCNCSICSMSGNLHFIVPASRLRLIRGEESLTTYSFNTGVAKHLFCRFCGIKSFYIPRSNPDGYGVTVRCLSPQPSKIVIEPFDGRNWERHAAALASLSRDA